jgi:tripartite-type tricarboxylate transporter receptor subunit TctC
MISLSRAFLVGLGALLFAAAGHAAYPERPITLIVPWAAGGGTDGTARIIGTCREGVGQPVNRNRVGGSGVVGHSAIAQAAPDGYIDRYYHRRSMMYWQASLISPAPGTRRLRLVNADPAGVQVAADSPYKSVNELVGFSSRRAQAFKPGTGQGGICIWRSPACCRT